MDNSFFTDLLYPIISTGIGAVIGGLFAYKIAKERFASDYINQGKTCALFIQSVAKSIADQSKDLQKCLDNRMQSSAEEFLPVLFNKNAILEEALTRYVLHWDRYGEKLYCCTMKHICVNTRARTQYDNIYSKINDTNTIIRGYQSLIKDYSTQIGRDSTTGKITKMDFYSTQKSDTILQVVGNSLRRLEDGCTQIIYLCERI